MLDDDDLLVSERRSRCATCRNGVMSIDGGRCRLILDDVRRVPDPVEYRRRLLNKSPAGCPSGEWISLEADSD